MPADGGRPSGRRPATATAGPRTTRPAGGTRRWGSPPPPGWDEGRSPRARAERSAPPRPARRERRGDSPDPSRTSAGKASTPAPAQSRSGGRAKTAGTGGARTAAKTAPETAGTTSRRAGATPKGRVNGRANGRTATKGAGRAKARPGGPKTPTPARTRSRAEAAPRPRRRRLWRWLLRLTLAGAALLVVAVAGLAWYVFATPLPAEAPEAQTTFVYDANGEKLASFFNGENRESVPLARVPEVMVDAVLAAEDRNFYSHGGVDPLSVVRAVYQDVRGGGSLQGGSTITQQYAKNAFVGSERTLLRKAKEAVVSLKLERKYTKDEILERYLNAIYFGRGAYGIQAASQAYFRKNVDALTLPEASYLAGLIRGPETADARRAPEMAATRRTRVLNAMVRTGSITAAQKRAAEAVPLSGPGGIVAPRPGPGQAYEHTDVGTQYFIDYVRRALIKEYGADRVFGGGLRVKTTLDLGLQRAAYQAVAKTLDRKGDPDAAVVALDRDGRVRAMVGGRDWEASRVNLAVGRGYGGVGRQGGSAFKPFVLATVLREGYTAESAFSAPAEITIEGAGENGSDWVVGNDDDHSYSGRINLVDAMTHSVNTVFAQVVTAEEIGPKRVAAMARDLGVTSPLDPVNAIALGAENVSPLEMADAYLTFANRGVRAEPLSIVEVRTSGGRLLQRNSPERRRVLDASHADVVNDALRRVVRQGTGTNARVAGVEVAGKTGTTQNYGDAWFVGYTPGRCCATAVWMGYAEGQSISMDDVHGRRVTGGSFPAQIFSRFMTAATKGEKTGEFVTVDELEGELLGSSRRSTGAGASSSSRTTVAAKRRTRDTVVEVERPAVTAVADDTGSETGSVGGAPDGDGVADGDGTEPAVVSSSDHQTGGLATGEPEAVSPSAGSSPVVTQPAPVVTQPSPAATVPPQTVATLPPQTVATVPVPNAPPASTPTG